MVALEFSGTIQQGTIQLPREYAEYNNAQVRIIVLVEEPTAPVSRKEQLLALFKRMGGLPMFNKIDDPKVWQKQLRDEWD
jgi:hypothetical protein